MSRSQRSSIKSQESEEEVSDDIVNDFIKVVLTLDHIKRPMKQTEILSNMLVKPKRKQMKNLFDSVNTRLNDMGFKLVEYPGATIKSYILLTTEPDNGIMHEYLPSCEKADRTLLVLILAYIFMKEGPVAEDEILRHLEQLHILSNSPHEYFGDVKKKLQGQFIEQGYLTRTQAEGDFFAQFQWGQRAVLEVPQLEILEFVCKIGYSDQVKPQNWVSHYQQIESQEQD